MNYRKVNKREIMQGLDGDPQGITSLARKLNTSLMAIRRKLCMLIDDRYLNQHHRTHIYTLTKRGHAELMSEGIFDKSTTEVNMFQFQLKLRGNLTGGIGPKQLPKFLR